MSIKKRNRLILFALFLIVCVAFFYVFYNYRIAFKGEKLQGFTETKTGLLYKIDVIGDGTRKPSLGDYLSVHTTYRTLNDSLLSDSLSIFRYEHPSFKGSFEEMIEVMNEGDLFVFIQPFDLFFQNFLKIPKPSHLVAIKDVKMQFRLNKIISQEELLQERKRMLDIADVEEQRRLKQYITENKILVSPINGGMYCIPLVTTDKEKVELGKYVLVSYKGYFLDGTLFDIGNEKKPLDFIFGDQYQVIRGIEYGISLMREGEKTKFIIPSQLAYGEKGSSSGIVPPYTTVIYEVEVLTVK